MDMKHRKRERRAREAGKGDGEGRQGAPQMQYTHHPSPPRRTIAVASRVTSTPAHDTPFRRESRMNVSHVSKDRCAYGAGCSKVQSLGINASILKAKTSFSLKTQLSPADRPNR